MRRAILGALAGAVLLTLLATPADAHPHVWVQVRDTFRFDDQGRIQAIVSRWWLDDVYTASALAGLDHNRDGVYSTAELAPLRKEMRSSFSEHSYFTFLTSDGQPIHFGRGADLSLAVDATFLMVELELPLAEPIDPRRSRVELRSLDESYFVAIDLVPEDPVHLEGGVPTSCHAVVESPSEDDAEATLNDNVAKNLDLARSYAMNAATAIRIECT